SVTAYAVPPPFAQGRQSIPPHLRLWGKLANVGIIGGLSAPPLAAAYSLKHATDFAGGFDSPYGE
ncbi:MAG: hypothetical protein ACI3YE_06635, partial [Candidatus Avispirillum sp.]